MAMYPKETAMVSLMIVGLTLFYIEISKFWIKPLYTTCFGAWRVNRYLGRMYFKSRGDARLFRKDSSVKFVKGYIRMPWQRKFPIILKNEDILHHLSNKIVMNKKYIYWSENDNAYHLTDQRPFGYMIDPCNLERLALRKIDDIDTKSTRAARAAPQTVHQGLLQFSIPLTPGSYAEKDSIDKYGTNQKNLFDRESIGGYKELDFKVDNVVGKSLKERMQGD
jgi:hypothetical protein